jgi:putative cardiolipin synthase
MPRGEQGFRTRLGLANLAEKTLDMQYYIWEVDSSGILLAERALRAADRGVRVRILLDHVTTKETDFKFARMDVHPNIEIRLFNPFANRSMRTMEFLFGLDRLNHRMHNKAFIVDNAVAVVGGRNIGDAYFGVDAAANFRDLDLAMIGPVVSEISHSFDRYWNSRYAVPIAAIVDDLPSEKEFQEQKQRLYEYALQLTEYPYPIDTEEAVVEARLSAPREKLIWASAKALYDEPEKLETGDEDVADRLIELGQKKDHEVMIEAAYVIPGPAGVERTRQNKERRIRQRLLTNSLATNDVVAAHAGYAKYRADLVRNGLELYELQPSAPSIKKNWSPLAGRSRASVHTKVFVADRELVGIGSFNMDPRSIALNTEIVVLVESRELASQVLDYMEEGIRPENAYRVLLETDSDTGVERLAWVAEVDGRTIRYYSEPETSVWQRFTSWFMGLLPIEEHL